LYNNQNRAEEYVIKACDEMEGDQEALLDAAKFYMRKGEQYAEKAQTYLRDAYSFGMKNQAVALMYACLLVQNGRYDEANVILLSLASQQYETAKVNMLLSITAGMVNNESLSKKYKAMALIDYMRSKGKVPEAGTLKQREPGSHQPEKGPQEDAPVEGDEGVEQKERTNEVTSQAAFKNIRLTQEEENEAYLELSEFLLDKSLCVLSG
jgi:predicted Zn-dependent protease